MIGVGQDLGGHVRQEVRVHEQTLVCLRGVTHDLYAGQRALEHLGALGEHLGNVLDIGICPFAERGIVCRQFYGR